MLATAPIVFHPAKLIVRTGICGQHPPLSFASESACFGSHPVPTGLRLYSIRHLANTVDWNTFCLLTGVWAANLAMERKLNVRANSKIRSSAYHTSRGPAPPERFHSFRYLLPPKPSSPPSSKAKSVPLPLCPSLTGPDSGSSGSSHSTWLSGLAMRGSAGL